MPDEQKKLCPIMARLSESQYMKLGPVFCYKDECALWDPLLKCCSHMSLLLEGRTEFRVIMAELVVWFQEDQEKAEEKLGAVEEKYAEAQKVDTAFDVMESHRERIGELKGKIDIIEQVCGILKRRFML